MMLAVVQQPDVAGDEVPARLAGADHGSGLDVDPKRGAGKVSSEERRQQEETSCSSKGVPPSLQGQTHCFHCNMQIGVTV